MSRVATLIRMAFKSASVLPLITLLSLLSTAHALQEQATPEASAKTESAVLEKEVPESLADLQKIEEILQKNREKMTLATVAVQVGSSQGSGVVINKDGYILTAAHVIGRRGLRATVWFSDGSTARAETLGVDHDADAGVLRIVDSGDWKFCDMADPQSLKVGSWCVATGHPGGFRNGRPPVIRIGRVNNINPNMIRTDATLVGGDSGGPLFDLEGRVIGINSRIGVSTSWNLHVPVGIYQKDWKALSSPAGFLGVGGDEYNRKGPCKLNMVRPDSPAAKAGIRPNDIIKKFDGKEVKNFTDLVQIVSKYPPDQAIEVEILRNKKTIILEVTLARRDPYGGIR